MRNSLTLALLFGFVAACSSTPGLKVSNQTVKQGDTINVTYTSPVKSKEGSKYWVTLSLKASPDSTWGDWHYVAADATTDTLKAGQPGEYEVRLHDDYPKQAFHVIARQTVKVE
jgi:hypothetical protein